MAQRPRSRLLTVALGVLTALWSAAAWGADAPARPDPDAAHARALVLDSHADIPLDFGKGAHDAGVDGDPQVDLPKLKRGGVGAVVLAVFAPQGPRTPEGIAKARAVADAKLAAIRGVAASHPDQAELALSVADVVRIHAAGKVAVIAGFLNAYPFGASLAPIDDYYAAGVRTFGFVHAGGNDYADSSRPAAGRGAEWGGLSPLGRQAVGKLNRLGVVIDVSQLTPEGVLQTVALSKAPVIASHSAVRGRVDSPRNLGDAELDAIARSGGVVQIVAFGPYLVNPGPGYADKVRVVRARFGLSADFAKPADGADALGDERRTAYAHEIAALLPKASVKDLVDAVDYAVRRIGVDHVGLASDFNHGGGVVGWSNEGEAANVTRELVRRGYSEADVGKIWGGNFLRVFAEVEAVAKRQGGA
ncbi:membrane dipeptidase [Caulobacter sp. CCUG 60055]|uniref:dipeptidase n=1 Tax=Caulobacter sp. CCUG 60055 TaxID=2100090 RepID=UPI001FA7593A|nr:dipeptidase [Caulobacter sp. CCUG 60055]MCI3179430.1 membrane dipeptidase [Caulobacter sp. CCUG 60055]